MRGPNYLDIPSNSIRAKEYLSSTEIDKAAGKNRGYFPDFSVWERALPVFIIEAKAPDVQPEEGYRETSLYARHLNQKYRSNLNPCRFILSCNGQRLLVGYWDSEPELDLDVSNLVPGSNDLDLLRKFCQHRILADHAAEALAQLKFSRFYLPVSQAGGQAVVNSKKPFNSFAAELLPVLRSYFTSTSQNTDPEIYKNAYVGSDDITTYDRVLEAYLKDRITSRRGPLAENLNPTKSKEPKLSAAIGEFKSADSNEGQLQLVTGGVGTGKLLFARRFKEILQPSEQRAWTHWAFVDFNTAPASLENAEDWLCEQFVKSFSRENPNFDPYAPENLSRVFSRDLFKRRGVYAQHAKASEADAERSKAEDLSKWQEDPQKLAFGLANHFSGDRQEVVVVVMDNVDRLDLKNQLLAFQLALWFMEKSKAFILLQMRDETYERFKSQPPLDTFRTGVTFHINPPRFLDVVKRRLELCLEYLSKNTADTLQYDIGAGAKITYPNTMLGEFLKGIYLELFEHKKNISRVLQGIAGRDVRRALEMFVSILTSGHLSPETITSHGRGAGGIALPEHTILKILMRTEYRFFSDNSGFVSNIFHVDEKWVQPNNFLIPEILFWLCHNRKRQGSIGLEGYFSIQAIADELQPKGFIMDDVLAACSWLLERKLVEADHMNTTEVEFSDSIKVTASGFIHIRILCERVEYLYGVLPVTPISDKNTAAKIGSYVQRENTHHQASANQKANCVGDFAQYLEYQHRQLTAAYPAFGNEHSGASFVLSQIQSTLSHFRNPSIGHQGNLLDN